mgnify:CR=1 FL=1
MYTNLTVDCDSNVYTSYRGSYQRRSSLLAANNILFSPDEYLAYTIVLGAHSLVIHVLLIVNKHVGIHILIIKTPIDL